MPINKEYFEDVEQLREVKVDAQLIAQDDRIEIALCVRKLIETQTSDVDEYSMYVDITADELISVTGMDSFSYIMVYGEIGALFSIEHAHFSEELMNDVKLSKLVDFILKYKKHTPSQDDIDELFEKDELDEELLMADAKEFENEFS